VTVFLSISLANEFLIRRMDRSQHSSIHSDGAQQFPRVWTFPEHPISVGHKGWTCSWLVGDNETAYLFCIHFSIACHFLSYTRGGCLASWSHCSAWCPLQQNSDWHRDQRVNGLACAFQECFGKMVI
jgi:hypothetical protein